MLILSVEIDIKAFYKARGNKFFRLCYTNNVGDIFISVGKGLLLVTFWLFLARYLLKDFTILKWLVKTTGINLQNTLATLLILSGVYILLGLGLRKWQVRYSVYISMVLKQLEDLGYVARQVLEMPFTHDEVNACRNGDVEINPEFLGILLENEPSGGYDSFNLELLVISSIKQQEIANYLGIKLTDDFVEFLELMESLRIVTVADVKY